jgi:hypothetical protein
MAKQAYVYSGTDWVPLASEVTNLSDYYTKGEIDILDTPVGLKKLFLLLLLWVLVLVQLVQQEL